MDTSELATCMSSDFWISKNKHGVFPRNRLPDCSFPGLYIVNVDLAGQPGSHWFLICVDGHCNGLFFDYLGSSQPYTRKVKKIIHNDAIIVTDDRLQSLDSNVCGGYALYFARELAKGTDICSMMLPFTPYHTVRNDEYVWKYTQKHFGVTI